MLFLTILFLLKLVSSYYILLGIINFLLLNVTYLFDILLLLILSFDIFNLFDILFNVSSFPIIKNCLLLIRFNFKQLFFKIVSY